MALSDFASFDPGASGGFSPNPGAGAPPPAPPPPPPAGPPQTVDYASALPQAPPPALPLDQALKLYGRAPGVAKTGFQPTSRTVATETKEYPAEAYDAQKRLLKAQDELAQAQLEAEQAQGGAGRLAAGLKASQQDAWNAADASYQQDQSAKLLADRDHVKSLMTKAADYKEDPTQWFKDKPTFGKIMTGVTAALQGFMYGFTRGQTQNPADWINQQIRESVEGQRAEHAAKKGAASDALQTYALNKEALGDESRAHMAQELAARQAVISRIDQMAADNSAPAMGRLRMAQLSKDLSKEQADVLMGFFDKTAEKHTVSGAERFQQAGGSQDPLVQLRRAVEGQKLVGEGTGTGLPALKETAEVRKTLAETEGAEALAAKNRAGAKGGAPDLATIANSLKSVAYQPWRSLQGTQAYHARLALKDWNTQILGAVHKSNPAARGLEAMQALGQAYLIDDGDTADTIRDKTERGIARFGGALTPSGVTEGVVPE